LVDRHHLIVPYTYLYLLVRCRRNRYRLETALLRCGLSSEGERHAAIEPVLSTDVAHGRLLPLRDEPPVFVDHHETTVTCGAVDVEFYFIHLATLAALYRVYMQCRNHADML
jgi:hypothetical protein